MPITNLQVETLRSLLEHDMDKHWQLYDQLDSDGKRGFLFLGTAAFLEGVKLHFRGKKRSDIVQWVANVRANSDPDGRIDPSIAERLILWAFDKATVDDLDVRAGEAHQAMLLALIVDEKGFDQQELSEFLDTARTFADAAEFRQ